MSISHTINVSDLTDQDALLRVLLEIQNNGTSYSLIQNGIEVARVVPAEEESPMESDNLTKKRLEVLAKMETFSEKIARLWSTNETASEAVVNDRR